MQFAIEPLGKRLLDDAVFFRIKEQLLISLRIFHISLLCGCVKDTGKNTSLVNLPIIAFSSFFDFCILAHFCIKSIHHNAVSICEVTKEFFVDSGNDLIERTKSVFLSSGAFRLSGLPGAGSSLQLNRSFVSLFKTVVFQFHAVVEVKRLRLVGREQLGKVRAENVFLMKFLIEHPCNLRNVVIPFHECTDFSAELVPLFLIPLLAYPIQNSSMANSVVLDPFGGSGSTLIACEQTDRICYAIELDEKFCDVIVKRYIEQVGSDEKVSVLRDGKEYKYSEVVPHDE